MFFVSMDVSEVPEELQNDFETIQNDVEAQEQADAAITGSSTAFTGFETVVDTSRVDGVPIWLFPVYDGQDEIVLSGESGDTIRMARYEIGSDPTAVRTWTTVADTNTTGGDGIADHWHIFTHDYHWIVFSTDSANTSYLLKIDTDFNVVDSTVVVDQYEITDALGQLTFIPTNDMFMVETDDGVAVAYFWPGIGHKLFLFDTSLEQAGTAEIGGGAYTHGNGSSALHVGDEYWVFAGETLNNVAHSPLQLLKFDGQWNQVSEEELVNEERTNLAFTSAVILDNGTMIIHSRIDDEAYPEGELPPPPDGTRTDDRAGIVRYVISADGELLDREILVESDAHRPHTELVDDYLITTWDTVGSTYLRVDQILTE